MAPIGGDGYEDTLSEYHSKAKEDVTNLFPNSLAACDMPGCIKIRLEDELPQATDLIVLE